jgi:RHS repeat-associated protein
MTLRRFFVPHERYKLRTHMITRLHTFFSVFAIALFASTQTHAQTQPINASFESPSRSLGQYANPTDATWSFTGLSGIYSNVGGVGSHHGVHLAYLKGSSTAANRGRVSQVVNFATPGLYQLRFMAGGTGTLSASVGGAVVGNTLRPRLSTGYHVESWWTQPFSIAAAGAYEIAFSQESAVDTESTWIDNVIVASSPLAFTNASFEQSTSGVPTGWTVSNALAEAVGTNRGVQGNAWLSFSANGTATTTINVPTADTYSVSFRSMGSATCGIEVRDVTSGGNVLLATLPFSTINTVTGAAAYTSASFALPAGARSIRFSSTCANKMDHVVLNRAGPNFANASFETPVLPSPVNTFDVPWLSAPTGASWTFSGVDAGIQRTPGAEALFEPKAEVGVQYGRVRVAGQSISQAVTLDPGVYVVAAHMARGDVRLVINGTAQSLSNVADLRLLERVTAPFTILQTSSVTLGFEPSLTTSLAVDLPRIIKITEFTVPQATLALRVNGVAAAAVVPPGGVLDATVTASDPDGLQRIRVLRNGVVLAPENTAVAPASAASPLNVTVSPLSVGSYTYTAEATDHTGVIKAVSQSLVVNTLPIAALVSPTPSQVIRTLPISLQANASDADSSQTIAKIEFYQVANSVTTKLGEVLNPVGTATLANTYLAAGPTQLFVKVFDSAGGQSDSATINVTVTGLFNAGFERPGTGCSGSGCTSGSSGVYWQFVNSINNQAATTAGIVNNSTFNPRCVVPAPEGVNAARLQADSLAPGYSPPRLLQRVYLPAGVYDFSMKATRTSNYSHNLKVTLGSLTPIVFGMTTAYRTYSSSGSGLNIATAGFYDFMIDSASDYSTSSGAYACVDDVKLIARNNKPTFSSFTSNPTGDVNEPAPPISLTATASDPDASGYVARIEFLVGGASLTPPLQCVNSVSAPARPFTCNQSWSGALPGNTYVFTVRAVDDRGDTLGTTLHSVSTSVRVNKAPTVSFVYPTQFLAVPGSPVPLKVSVSDVENDAILYVDFFHYLDGAPIGRTTTGQAAANGQPAQSGSEYQFNATLMPGTYRVGARATDARGAVTISVPAIDFTVNSGNAAPTVLLNKNGELNSEYGSTDVSFTAQSNDVDGQVVETWIQYGASKHSCPNQTNTSATFCPLLLGATTPAGSYSVRGYARDNLDKVGSSSSGFVVNVSSRPILCNLTSARPNGGLIVNASNTLVVTCTNLNGDIVGGYNVTWEAPANCPEVVVAENEQFASCTVTPTSTSAVTYQAYVDSRNNFLAGGTLSKTFTPTVNQPPTITLISPGIETALASPATFNITVNPIDPDGPVKKVELLNGTSILETKTAAPWTFTWRNVPVGQYNVKAIVYDDLNATAEVVIPKLISNALPTATVTGVANNQAFAVGATATFTASASDSDGAVASVEYFVGGQSRFIATASPFTFAWSNLPNGDHVVTARATDNRGMQGIASSVVTIRVNSPPSIRLVAPINGAYVNSPPGGATIALAATDVSDPDGIASVTFFASNGWNTAAWYSIGSASGSPPNYSASWSTNLNAEAKYSIRACARDPRSAETCTAAINITVGAVPRMQCSLEANPAKQFYSLNDTTRLSAKCAANGSAIPPSDLSIGSWVINGSGIFPSPTCDQTGCTATFSAQYLKAYGNQIRYSVTASHKTSQYPSVPAEIVLAAEGNRVGSGTFESTQLVQSPNFALGTIANQNNYGWTFDNFSGVQRIGSGFSSDITMLANVNLYFEGFQTALVQNLGQTSTTINLSAGSYELSFQMANRRNFGGQQRVQIRLGSTVLQTITPSTYALGAEFSRYTVPFTANAGSYTLAFVGLNDDPTDSAGATTDNTALFDDVFLGRTGAATVAAPSSCSFSAGPTSLSTNQAGTFTVACSAGGAPFTYSWARNGTAIGGNSASVTDTPFTPADDTTLASVTYTVTITNAGGITQPTRAVTNLNYKGVPVSNAKLLFIHPDVKGSPLMATDATGAVLWREDYSAFGVRRKNEARANDGVGAYTPKGDAANSLWYIGKPQDNATGLVYFGARWYDPQVGRFMGFDPAGVDEDNPHSFNRYAYGNNNPYKYLDPDGRAPVVAQALSMSRAAAPAATIGDSVRGGGMPQHDPARGIMVYPAEAPSLRLSLEGYLQAAQTVNVLISPVAAAQKLADMIVTSVMKGTGSYTIDFDNGQRYHGKGGEERMRRSVTEKEKEHGCKAASCDWKSAPNNREALKDEAQRIRNDRGVQNPGNYNKINSPGEKYLEQDGQESGK